MLIRDLYVEKNLQTERTNLNDLEKFIYRVEEYIAKNPVLMEEIVVAREHYQEKAGKIKESYTDYENKINAFLYWFIFDWKCVKSNMDTPFDIFVNMNRDNLGQKERDACQEMINHHHSIFEFIKNTSKESVVYDLFRRKKLHLPDINTLFNFEKGCYFETRVFSIFEKLIFAPYIILYPFKANRPIKKQIKLLKKDPEKMKELILKLEYFNFKQNTYSKFEIDKIYVF